MTQETLCCCSITLLTCFLDKLGVKAAPWDPANLQTLQTAVRWWIFTEARVKEGLEEPVQTQITWITRRCDRDTAGRLQEHREEQFSHSLRKHTWISPETVNTFYVWKPQIHICVSPNKEDRASAAVGISPSRISFQYILEGLSLLD